MQASASVGVWGVFVRAGQNFDVAVVGGGVIGLSCARELMRQGAERVVVLEREAAVGQRSSSRANGGVRAQFTTAINIDFSLYSIAEFERLQTESEGDLSFHQTGYLLMTGTEEGERDLEAARNLQRERGVPTRWLSPKEIAERAPFVRSEGLRAGTFHERDGFLDPHAVVQTMQREAAGAGAEIRTSSPVDAIEDGGERFLVRAVEDELMASWVVDAAGSHARAVGALAGVEVPVDPVRRNLAYARDPGGTGKLIPMCVDLDTGVLVRKEVAGGYVIAYSDPADPPGWDESVDPKFLDELAARVGHRFPFLQEIPIDARHAWAGLYPETGDHHAIVGPAPGSPRFVICAGFGGHGIMHSPAAGRAVAEIVCKGACTTFDVHPLRLARFAEDDLIVESAVL